MWACPACNESGCRASHLSSAAGLLGANFGPNLMTAVGIKDTIARGMAAAGTAGGLGTASLTSKVGAGRVGGARADRDGADGTATTVFARRR